MANNEAALPVAPAVLLRTGDQCSQDYEYIGDGEGFWVQCGAVVLWVHFDYDGGLTVEALPTEDADGEPLATMVVDQPHGKQRSPFSKRLRRRPVQA